MCDKLTLVGLEDFGILHKALRKEQRAPPPYTVRSKCRRKSYSFKVLLRSGGDLDNILVVFVERDLEVLWAESLAQRQHIISRCR